MGIRMRVIAAVAVFAAAALSVGAVAAGQARDRRPPERPQPRAEPRRPAPPRPAPPRPSKRGTFIFIGGYFYDPFFGPYPWWPRGAYPPWYYPVYDYHAEVRVAATPRHAAVYVDGFYAGIVDDFDGTFQRLALPAGGHRLALYLEGYVTEEFSIYLRPRSTFTLRHTMLRLPPGGVSEHPVLSGPVPPPPEGTYAPPRGTPPPVQMPAPPPPAGEPGTVELHVQPASATVTIDGAAWLSSDPGLFVVQLPSGRHHVEVSAPGYRTFTADIDVAVGEVTPLNVSLVRAGLR
ncbi:MAG: PEGA domain-containing protein [Vicinamibacterales bacterium]